MSIAIAVVAALLAACCFGVAAVLQQSAARTAPQAASLRPGLVLGLAQRPLWLAGIAMSAFSYLVQGVALAFGPLVLVQPLASTDLAFALPLVARRRRIPLSRVEKVGVGCVTGGIAAFLAVLPAGPGLTTPPFADWVPLLLVVAALVGVLAPAGLRSRGRTRAALYAAAAGLLFAVIDSLTKSTADQFRASGLRVLGHWEPYALMVIGAAGLLLAQSSFQAASLAISLPIIDTLEPIGSVVTGVVVFGEPLASSWALLLQLLGAAVAVTGIVILSRSRLMRS